MKTLATNNYASPYADPFALPDCWRCDEPMVAPITYNESGDPECRSCADRRGEYSETWEDITAENQ